MLHRLAAINHGLSVLINGVARQKPILARAVGTMQWSEAHVLCLGFHSKQSEAQEKKI